MPTDRSWWFSAPSDEPAAGQGAGEIVEYPTARQRWMLSVVLFAVLLAVLARCQAGMNNRGSLRIVAGSGFSSFEPILKRWDEQNGVDVRTATKAPWTSC
jgi:hypothetical protein